ncbi:MAG: endonuclease/exonuclease/phosphatase family protein, partial [Actinomycetota bacterium]
MKRCSHTLAPTGGRNVVAERALLKVATFNLHHCEGLDGVVDVGRAAAAIEALDAGVIALQELDRGLPRSGRVDQVAEIERATEMHLSFHATVLRAGGEYGIAIATRDRLDPEVVDLPGGDGSEPRVALICELPTEVAIVATHLSRKKHREIQERQLARLAEIVAARPGPAVLMGDLNREPDELGALTGAGLRPAIDAFSFPARAPRRQLDHILVSEEVQV